MQKKHIKIDIDILNLIFNAFSILLTLVNDLRTT